MLWRFIANHYFALQLSASIVVVNHKRKSWLHGECCWRRAPRLQRLGISITGHSRVFQKMIFLGRIRCWRLLLTVLITSTVSVGQSPVPAKFSIAAGRKTSTTLPFDLIDNRVFVEVHLNGRGPFHFILDTGANGFSLADTTAQTLGLKTEDVGEGPGVGEKTVHVSRAHLAEAQLGELQFGDSGSRRDRAL